VKTVTVKLDEEIVKLLDLYAEATGECRAEVVRKAVVRFLSRRLGKRRLRRLRLC